MGDEVEWEASDVDLSRVETGLWLAAGVGVFLSGLWLWPHLLPGWPGLIASAVSIVAWMVAFDVRRWQLIERHQREQEGPES